MSFINAISRALGRPLDGIKPENATELNSLIEQFPDTKGNRHMSEASERSPYPKILAVGLADTLVRELNEYGLEIKAMDLGDRYSVAPSAALLPVPRHAPFPDDYKEHEIVIVDVIGPLLPINGRNSGTLPAQKVDAWWCDCKTGMINTRLLYGSSAREGFDGILKHGGLFVIFADSYKFQEFTKGHLTYKDNVQFVNSTHAHNYDFLSALTVYEGVNFHEDQGTVVSLCESIRDNNAFGKAFIPFLKNVKFSCTLSVGRAYEKGWTPLLQNKFGAVVSALVEIDGAYILLLPDFNEKSALLKSLFDDVLPVLKPEIFPHHKTTSWSELPDYELSQVTELKRKIAEVQKREKEEVARLNAEIENQRTSNQYIFDLVGESGEKLVHAVLRSLKLLGFENVIDADAELAGKGITRQNLEDLQIHDSENTILVEIKGINGYPSDDDALAVRKYVTLRMKEWKRFNVKALTIINHQRNLPPLQRGNNLPFRKELIDIGVEEDIGFMTGWDLHRLVRSFIVNQWTHGQVKSIFSRNGRIDIIPANYEKVGVIQRHIKAASILGVLLEKELRSGEKLGYELSTLFKEEVCESLQLNNSPVVAADAGQVVGILTSIDPDHIKVGMPVYRVN